MFTDVKRRHFRRAKMPGKFLAVYNQYIAKQDVTALYLHWIQKQVIVAVCLHTWGPYMQYM